MTACSMFPHGFIKEKVSVMGLYSPTGNAESFIVLALTVCNPESPERYDRSRPRREMFMWMRDACRVLRVLNFPLQDSLKNMCTNSTFCYVIHIYLVP